MARRPPARSSRQLLGKGNSGPAQGCDGIAPEGAWLVLEVVHGDPGNSSGFGRCPQRQGHRFAHAGRAGDDGQRAPPRALGDQLGDPRPRHRPARHTWRGDPGGQDGDASGNCRPPGGSRHLPGNIGHHRTSLLPAGGPRAARHGRPRVAIPSRPAAVPGCLALINHHTPASQARHHAIGIKKAIGMNLRTLGCSGACDSGKSVSASSLRGCKRATISPHDSPAPTCRQARRHPRGTRRRRRGQRQGRAIPWAVRTVGRPRRRGDDRGEYGGCRVSLHPAPVVQPPQPQPRNRSSAILAPRR